LDVLLDLRLLDFVDLRLLDLRPFAAGTFPPDSRASLRPMAIACLRLVTLRPEPLVNVPRLRRRSADATLRDAAFPYFAMCASPRPCCNVHADGSCRHGSTRTRDDAPSVRATRHTVGTVGA